MTTPAARAIVIKDGLLLVIRRVKKGHKYMVTPGGRIEEDETPETALIREMEEETGVLVKDPRLVFAEDPLDRRWGTQYIFLADYVSGEPALHPDSQEAAIMSSTKDIYHPEWYPISKLKTSEYPFLSERLRDEIINGYDNGFPADPLKWSL